MTNQRSQVHYLAPGRITRRVMNPLVAGLTRLGLPLAGSAVLGVRGRRSGEVRTTPVNPLRHDGARYLVAARGETQWVRNLRVAGEAELTVGRRTERVAATELTEPAAVVPVLREYLRRWAWEVGAFFDGVDASSSDAELAAVAHRHPIFVLAA
ncbi:nitroreductase family deazaflavin-dependent oxidoreductase [Pseudonocardia alni]|jgi:deazaflavin-dependent oxidoreductase (nitroreductase family)|uniref:nitroreductase family deazaflavin-dependent oxidoreductase n=1 Tax=Pseudonocardia alni TaxID=33907 RepID=UPI0006CB3161|nr:MULTISPECIES: nitroreductase family deazaflavin-dependent oxidoreductase [Pseudonocardia]ALE78783.1 deazaflavin-dependent nitroreductase [Pseudonocardia sp. AL041005-10]NWJ74115.1 nitroreductase family deazaflavin-dependent oxidoreductase [Pseudonocardia pini]